MGAPRAGDAAALTPAAQQCGFPSTTSVFLGVPAVVLKQRMTVMPSPWSVNGRQIFPPGFGFDFVIPRQPRLGSDLARRGQVQHFQIARSAINFLRSAYSQPQSTATFTIFQFQLNYFGIFAFHDCLRSSDQSPVIPRWPAARADGPRPADE